MLAFIHPVVWLIQMAMVAQRNGQDPTGYVVLATFLLPTWVLVSRFLAEIPGSKHGRMFLWWLIFIVFHVWGLLFLLFIDQFSNKFINRMRAIKRLELADRSPDQIMASPFEVFDSVSPDSSEITGLPPASVYYSSPLSSDGQFKDE